MTTEAAGEKRWASPGAWFYANAMRYFQYFGSAAGTPGQGYHSYDVGVWHIIALNSNCGDAGGCSANSPQGKWLQADLAAHSNFCTLAYWHIPLFSSGGRANNNSKAFWDLLYTANADLILTGHDHTNERFAPQASSGTLDQSRGLREFVVGTGGANTTSFVSVQPNSEVPNDQVFGILKLTLHPTSYDWQFEPIPGMTLTDAELVVVMAPFQTPSHPLCPPTSAELRRQATR